MRLVDVHPRLDATSLASRFSPPARFDAVRFENYVPDDAYPSQTQARNALEGFAGLINNATGTKRWWQRKTDVGKPARYLDGGFGVGKTHLLASLWHGVEGEKAYLSFGELTAYIGYAGMNTAVDSFRNRKLICVDEFELDDVANTLMVVTFLRNVLNDSQTFLAVTSNTLPDRLGEQRFSASEFRREITAIASHFDEMRIEGGDYRTGHVQPQLVTRTDNPNSSNDSFDDLLIHLKTIHPVHYGAMLDGVDEVNITGLHSVDDQDEALLVVQLVDKLYDARIPVHISGCEPDDLFDKRFRNGGYRKKYGRAESRLLAMRKESDGS